MKFPQIEPWVKDARVLDVDWGCTRYILSRRTRDDFDAIVFALASREMILAQRHTIGNNEFATLRSAEGEISISYFDYNRTVCLVTDDFSEGRVAPPLAPSSYEVLTTPTLAFIGLDYSDPEREGTGMSFVMKLADGSYIVYDGGLRIDAPILLDYLEKNNVRAEKPRIAAWVLTHSHGDHYLAMREFARVYADRVTVEHFLLTPRLSRYEFEQYEGVLGEIFPVEDLPKFEGAKMIKPHTGQLLHYRDAQIEILHTQEEMLPNQFRWMNEASMITRVYLGGQKILFPADGELGTDVQLPVTYGYALESDFLQVPHHAYSGGSYTMYDLVRAKVACFTCNQNRFDKWTTPSYNGGKSHYLISVTPETYHSEMGTQVFDLPYTPRERDGE